MKTLRGIMREGFLFTVQRNTTVATAVRTMAANNVGIVAVVDADRLCGVFSERDVVQRVVDRGLDPARTRVADVMTSSLVVADADEFWLYAMLFVAVLLLIPFMRRVHAEPVDAATPRASPAAPGTGTPSGTGSPPRAPRSRRA